MASWCSRVATHKRQQGGRDYAALRIFATERFRLSKGLLGLPNLTLIKESSPQVVACGARFREKKPPLPSYPRELRTLGAHLRKRRLDLGSLRTRLQD